MRTTAKILLLLIALWLQPRAFCQATDAENKILAVVNDEIVTQADLDMGLSSAIDELKKGYSGAELEAKISATRKECLNQIIDDKLILQEAKKRDVNCSTIALKNMHAAGHLNIQRLQIYSVPWKMLVRKT